MRRVPTSVSGTSDPAGHSPGKGLWGRGQPRAQTLPLSLRPQGGGWVTQTPERVGVWAGSTLELSVQASCPPSNPLGVPTLGWACSQGQTLGL